MSITKNFLVIVLISMITSVAMAQAPKNNDVAKLSKDDIARIKHHLTIKTNLLVDDSVMVMTLLNQNNTPEKGMIEDDGEIIQDSLTGDEWNAYISKERDCFWLTYVVYRKKDFIGRIGIRLD